MPRKEAVLCSRILAAAALPVLERARQLQRLEQTVLQLLPKNLSAHCKVQNLKSEILILTTSSPAWAARLRFAVPDLIKQLECQLALTLGAIQIKIEPGASDFLQVKQRQAKLSLASGCLLAQTAHSVNHPALQEALYRLAAKASDF